MLEGEDLGRRAAAFEHENVALDVEERGEVVGARTRLLRVELRRVAGVDHGDIDGSGAVH